MGQNLLTPNANATSLQVSALATSISNLPTTTSLATQSNLAIKSIQRGSAVSFGEQFYINISHVNTNKTEMRVWLGGARVSDGYPLGLAIFLNSSTQIYVNGGHAVNPQSVFWELTEFY
jgi:hypothetical protein